MSDTPGVKQVVKAVLGALVGVQSEQQRQQDFQTTRLWPYLAAAIVAVVIFVVALLLVANWALSN